MIKKGLIVNGIMQRLVVGAEDTLAQVLRNNLMLTGTKVGCGEGQCGACSSLMGTLAVEELAEWFQLICSSRHHGISCNEIVGAVKRTQPSAGVWGCGPRNSARR